jgi:hypothetical protein
MSCSFVISQCLFYCFGSVMQCVGRCLETYANLGYVAFDVVFISMSWLVTFALSKILVYISDDFKFKITAVFGSPDFAKIQLFILLRICICLISLHFFLALGSFLRIKFFRILHQGLWSFKVFAVCGSFIALIFLPLEVIQIFLKSLTFLLALNFIVNLYVLFKHHTHEYNKCTILFEIILNVAILSNIVITFLYGFDIVTFMGQKTLYITSGLLLVLNFVRYLRRNFVYYIHNFLLQLYCILLLWTGWLLIQEKDHLEKVTIGFSTAIGLMNLIIPLFVVFARTERLSREEEGLSEEDEKRGSNALDEDEEDLELNCKNNENGRIVGKNSEKRKGNKKKSFKKRKNQKQNSFISLVHFSFMFLVCYFLETFICLQNLEDNIFKFHSHPYLFFLIACMSLMVLCKFCY